MSHMFLSYASTCPTYATESHLIISADLFGDGLLAVLKQMKLSHANVVVVPIDANGQKVNQLAKWLKDNNP